MDRPFTNLLTGKSLRINMCPSLVNENWKGCRAPLSSAKRIGSFDIATSSNFIYSEMIFMPDYGELE